MWEGEKKWGKKFLGIINVCIGLKESVKGQPLPGQPGSCFVWYDLYITVDNNRGQLHIVD